MAALASAADIPPGGEGTIKASIDVKGRSGKVVKTVTVETTDPDAKSVRLTLKANVLVEASLEPRVVNITRLEQGQEFVKTVKLVTRDPVRVKLTSVSVVEPVEGLTAKAVKVDDQDGVEVRFKASKVGVVRTHIKVGTTSTKVPTIDLPVYGIVLGAWEVSPRAVSFPEPAVEGGKVQPVTSTINVKARSKTPYKVTRAVDPEGNVAAKIVKVENGYDVELTLTKAPEARKGTIVLTTTAPDEKSIEVAYSVRKARPGLPPRPIKSLKRQLGPVKSQPGAGRPPVR